MKSVGVYEAKTHLARLLDEVERGETITITRHGRPVATLSAVDPHRRTPEQVLEAMREFRSTHSLRGLSIRDLINEGRRF